MAGEMRQEGARHPQPEMFCLVWGQQELEVKQLLDGFPRLGRTPGLPEVHNQRLIGSELSRWKQRGKLRWDAGSPMRRRARWKAAARLAAQEPGVRAPLGPEAHAALWHRPPSNSRQHASVDRAPQVNGRQLDLLLQPSIGLANPSHGQTTSF